MLQINFKRAHIAGSVNTAAGFLSGLELKITEKIRLKLREDIQTTLIEVTTSSSDVPDEEQCFFTQSYNEDESEEQTRERKKTISTKFEEWVAKEEPPSLKASAKELTKINGNTTAYSMNGIKTNARTPVEQDVDLALKNMKLKIPGQPHDELLFTTDPRYQHYNANKDRIIFTDGLLFVENLGETGGVNYYQNLVPNQLVIEVLRRLHGDFGKHPGITKTIIA